MQAPRIVADVTREAPDSKRSLRRGTTDACERLNLLLRKELCRPARCDVGRHPTPMYIIERIRELLKKQLETTGAVKASDVHRQVTQEGMPVAPTIVYREAKAMGVELSRGGAMPGGGRPKGSKTVNRNPKDPNKVRKPGGGRPVGTLTSPFRKRIVEMRETEKTPKGDPLPHGDIAARLGVSRQFVSQILKEEAEAKKSKEQEAAQVTDEK